MRKRLFSDTFYNRISFVGLVVVVTMLSVELFLFGTDFFSNSSNVYLGMLTYVVLPPFLITGILLIFLGAWRERRRQRLGLPHEGHFVVDFSDPKHRNTALIVTVVMTIFLAMTAVGAYKAFYYTESI